MKKLLLLLVTSLTFMLSFAQSKKTTYSAGLLLSKPAYFSNTESNNTTGVGLEIQTERLFSKNFSCTASLGYIHFSGTYTYIDYSSIAHDTSISSYGHIPLFAGLRYYCWKKLFLGAEIGAMIQGSSNTSTHISLAPSVGYKFDVAKQHGIDVGLRLINTLPGYGTPEANTLTKGGYGIWVLKAAYAF
ncbi:hypothetical protein [Pinibacter aurantiacus]|uniref:Outer membrane protein beta-barrel domain-containing protein n=1 Tax=Pinibacter aurantiacus TaxID=2851599 RepID=A0A9E2W3W2_9BACT|nr:hypothetical protein [Pinibacter aurantiacus]MBV4357244.1 hypothetical protein [Pinibacter aurantiacus]